MGSEQSMICVECSVPIRHGKKTELGEPPEDGYWKYGAFHVSWHKRFCACPSCFEPRTRRYLRREGAMVSIPKNICTDCACRKKGCSHPKVKGTDYCTYCQRCPVHNGINISNAPCKQCAKEWKGTTEITWRPRHHKKFPRRIRKQIETVEIISQAKTTKEDGWIYTYNEVTGGFSALPPEIRDMIYEYVVEMQRPAHC